MKEQFTYQVTAGLLRQGVQLHSARKHRLRLRANTMSMLELDDVLFSLDSAVLMPYAFPGDGSESSDSEELQGLDVLYITYRYAKDHPDERLIIAGHTDTSGAPKHNLELSDARAKSAFCLLKGKRTTWAKLCDEWHNTEDIQRLLKSFRQIDPGPVDGKMGPKTRQAIKLFKMVYNQDRPALGIPNSPEIAENDASDRQFWAAMFDYYMYSLAQMLGCGPAWTLRQLLGLGSQPASSSPAGESGPILWMQKMNQWRDLVVFADSEHPYLGCGESFPIDQALRDNYRSEKNRRVELLFFQQEDIPDIPASPPDNGLYSLSDCPMFDISVYASKTINVDALFNHWLEFQTVNETGKPVGNVDIVLKPMRGGEISAKSDGDGLCRVENLPPGQVRIMLSDGEAAAMRYEGRYTSAILNTHQEHDEEVVVAVVIVKLNLTEEERTERADERRIYGRQSAPAEVEFPEHSDEPSDSIPDQWTPPHPVFYAIDNLSLVAGLDDGVFNKKGLYTVLKEWLTEYFPMVVNHEYILFLLDDRALTCFNPSGEIAHIFPLKDGIGERLQGAFGGYMAFATPGDPLFRDMSNFRYVVSVQGMRDEDGIELNEIIQEDVVPKINTFFDNNSDKASLLYRAPTGGQAVGLADSGGAGYLEDYGVGGTHSRNMATVEFVAQAYKSVLSSYIKQVNGIDVEEEPDHPWTLEYIEKELGLESKSKRELTAEGRNKQQKVLAALLSLKHLGPPPTVYLFPRPQGATDEQWQELRESNYVSDYSAWVAISDKIDDINDRHSEGAVFFRVKFSLKASADPKTPGIYGEVKVEHTIDFGTDGFFHKREQTAAYGAKIGPVENKRLPRLKAKTENLPSAGYEEEVNIETGEKKSTVKAGIKGYGIEVSDDGEVKMTGPNGATAAYNDLTKVGGGGVTLPTPWGDIYVGLQFKGLLEESIAAYLSRAPGFFQRRIVLEYFDPEHPLLWNSMSHFEHVNLEDFGWDMHSWDRRSLTPFSEFPEPTRKKLPLLMDSNPEAYMAAVRLGMDREDWKLWKNIAKEE